MTWDHIKYDRIDREYPDQPSKESVSPVEDIADLQKRHLALQAQYDNLHNRALAVCRSRPGPQLDGALSALKAYFGL